MAFWRSATEVSLAGRRAQAREPGVAQGVVERVGGRIPADELAERVLQFPRFPKRPQCVAVEHAAAVEREGAAAPLELASEDHEVVAYPVAADVTAPELVLDVVGLFPERRFPLGELLRDSVDRDRRRVDPHSRIEAPRAFAVAFVGPDGH